MIKSRRLRWTGYVARMVKGGSSFKILTGKIYLGRPRRRCEENIRKDLKEIGANSRHWIDWAQDIYFWIKIIGAIFTVFSHTFILF